MEVTEIRRKGVMNTKPKAEVDQMIAKLKKEHSKLIKGMFEFLDAQGGWLDWNYRWFPDEPIQKFRITHGEICELPLGVVKHLNNTVKKTRNMAMEKPDGTKMPGTVTKTSRVRFTPVDVIV
jgi:hypothetical protein